MQGMGNTFARNMEVQALIIVQSSGHDLNYPYFCLF